MDILEDSRPAKFLKLRGSVIFGLAFIFIFSVAAHAQITTNNALPVGKGKGIVRMQNKIIRATGDPSGTNRELLVQAFPLVPRLWRDTAVGAVWRAARA